MLTESGRLADTILREGMPHGARPAHPMFSDITGSSSAHLFDRHGNLIAEADPAQGGSPRLSQKLVGRDGGLVPLPNSPLPQTPGNIPGTAHEQVQRARPRQEHPAVAKGPRSDMRPRKMPT